MACSPALLLAAVFFAVFRVATVSDASGPSATLPFNTYSEPFESACTRSTCCTEEELRGAFRGYMEGVLDGAYNSDRPAPFPGTVREAEGALNSTDGDKVWLFSYGSNMRTDKLTLWNVTAYFTIPAYLQGYAIRFDTAVKRLPAEPTYANLVRCPRSACVHGVVSLVDLAALKGLDRSETMYRRVEVNVTAYTGEQIFGASAYICASVIEEVKPSERYSSLVLCAAKHAQLCPSYISGVLHHFLNDNKHIEDYQAFCKQATLLPRNALMKG